MDQSTWTSVDEYFAERFIGADEDLDAALAASAEAGLPAIQVSPSQGKLLMLLARSIGARRVLELGTLGGYSTIWMARALPPGGRLVTIECDARHAAVASANIARAGLAGVVELRTGRAADVLAGMKAQRCEPFDLVFIDADKASMAEYFAWAVEHTRSGGVIIADNVVREGAVLDDASRDASVRGVRSFCEMAGADRRVNVTAVQTVGVKGYDGFALALVL